MSFLSRIQIVFILAVMVLGFQNCSSYQSVDPSNGKGFDSRNGLSGNGDPYTGIGNGDPYTGIVSKSGHYRNFGFDFQCPDGTVLRGLQTVATMTLDVDAQTVRVFNRCTRQVSDVGFDELRVPRLDVANVLFGGGIYQFWHSLDVKEPPEQQFDPTYRAVHCSTTDASSSLASTDLVVTRDIQSGQLTLESYFTNVGEVSELVQNMNLIRTASRVILSNTDESVSIFIDHLRGAPLQESYQGFITREGSSGSPTLRPIECTVESSLLN